jgi:hypothetical protein
LENWNKICGVFCLLLLGAPSLKAQILPYTGFDSTLRNPVPTCIQWISTVEKVRYAPTARSSEKILPKNDISYLSARSNTLDNLSSPASLGVGFNVKRLPFFCREEFQSEKITGIPLRFRVGSLQECDWLEQKPNALPPGR